MDNQPQCHPEKSQAKTDQDLQAEQDEFFLSGAQNSVEIVSSSSCSMKHNSYTPSLPVLSDVIENKCRKPVCAPIMKAPLQPVKFTKKAPETTQTTNVDDLKREVSRENDEKLAKMSQEEIEALKNEIFESVPESFLCKLRK